MDELWLQGVVRVGLLAVIFRGAAAAARAGHPPFPVASFGWVLCALAAWFATAAGGAWVALWVPLALGAAAALVARVLPGRLLLPAADLMFLLALFALSDSPVGIVPAFVAGLAYLLLGLLSDALATFLPAWFRAAAAAAPVLLAGLWLWHDAPFRGDLSRHLWAVDRTFPLHLGVAVPDAGKRVTVQGGAAAWVLRPRGELRGGTLLFHGSDEDGSHQRASYPLQRALLNQGYLVVSLDLPGYGQSSPPPRYAQLAAWDPLHAANAGYQYLDALLPPSLPRLITGYSMGANGALRLLATGTEPAFTILLGGRHHDLSVLETENYWYRRFHVDRRLDWQMPRRKWDRFRAAYYDSRVFTARLTKDHAPILFVDFEVDWPDMIANRGAMWEDLPGEKYRVELARTSHYLNAFSTRGFILADVRLVKWLGRPVRMLHEQSVHESVYRSASRP